MKILIVRHGIAGDRLEFAQSGRSDELRPLTNKGIERMKEITRGLHKVIDGINLIATSPLVRARQTADILHSGFNSAKRTELPELAPGQGPATLTDWLGHLYEVETVCLVGHEPDLSELISWLISGRAEGIVDLRKGSACLLLASAQPERANCSLAWLLQPKHLRQLAAA